MNEKRLTPNEAWKEFFEEIKKSPEWATFDRAQRQRIYSMDARYRKGGLGIRSIKNNLAKFAPGRYVLHEGEPFFTRG